MTPSIDQTFRIIESDIRLTIASPKLARPLTHLLCGFRTQDCSPGAWHSTLSLSPDGSVTSHASDGETQRHPAIGRFVPQFEFALIDRAVAQMPYVGLHAAAVSWHGRAVLLPGASGSGKTTLALACALKGARFLSDEIAVLHPATGLIRPFPRVLCVKNRNLSLFSALDTNSRLNRTGAVRIVAQTHCIRPDVLDCVPPDQWVGVRAIVFPRYRPDADMHLSSLPRTQAMIDLLKTLMHRKQRPESGFQAVADCVSTVPCYTLAMGDLGEAVSCIQTLCAQT